METTGDVHDLNQNPGKVQLMHRFRDHWTTVRRISRASASDRYLVESSLPDAQSESAA